MCIIDWLLAYLQKSCTDGSAALIFIMTSIFVQFNVKKILCIQKVISYTIVLVKGWLSAVIT